MPIPRFADLKTLSPELVARIDRAVTRAGEDVEEDHETYRTITVEINVRYNLQAGEVMPDYRIRVNGGDTTYRSAGMIRDSQLVLPGTGILSDMEPERAAGAAARNGSREHATAANQFFGREEG